MHLRKRIQTLKVTGYVLAAATAGTYTLLTKSPVFLSPTAHWTFILVAVFGTALALWATFRNAALVDQQRDEESRERLRHAEEALSTAQAGGPWTLRAGGDIVIHEYPEDRASPEGPESSEQVSTGESKDSEEQERPTDSLPLKRHVMGRGSRLEFSALWNVNDARLDRYHHIATGQAARSFRNAQVAAGLGFAMLIVFAVIAMRSSTAAGSIVAGGLGAVGAAMAGFVSRTFIRSQEVSAGHLRSYFDQPLEYSRYLLAERLVSGADLPVEVRAEAISSLAQSVAAGPPPPPDPNASPGQQGAFPQVPQQGPGRV